MKLARVVSASYIRPERNLPPKEAVEDNLANILKLLRAAAAEEPDVVCLPEAAPTRGLPPKDAVLVAEEIPGQVFEAVSSLAKEYSMYVVCPMIEKQGGLVYNSAVLIDRSGGLVGKYRKIHPTISEIESGITPGREQRPLKTDFGKIGFAICYDLNFEDVIKPLHAEDVKLVFFPTAYPGGLNLNAWALTYGTYIVSSRNGEGSAIVDPLGRTLVTSSAYSTIIAKTVNLDYEILHLDYNYEKIEAMKRKYGARVEVDVVRPEAVFMLASNAEDMAVPDLISEFDLEKRDDYFARARDVRDKALATLG